MPGAAPSIDGNASTIESVPLVHLLGADAPAMPGTPWTVAAIAVGLLPCWTRRSNGFRTPGLMPAIAGRQLLANAGISPGVMKPFDILERLHDAGADACVREQ